MKPSKGSYELSKAFTTLSCDVIEVWLEAEISAEHLQNTDSLKDAIPLEFIGRRQEFLDKCQEIGSRTKFCPGCYSRLEDLEGNVHSWHICQECRRFVHAMCWNEDSKICFGCCPEKIPPVTENAQDNSLLPVTDIISKNPLIHCMMEEYHASLANPTDAADLQMIWDLWQMHSADGICPVINSTAEVVDGEYFEGYLPFWRSGPEIDASSFHCCILHGNR